MKPRENLEKKPKVYSKIIIFELTRIFETMHDGKPTPNESIIDQCKSILKTESEKITHRTANRLVDILVNPNILEIPITYTNQEIYNKLLNLIEKYPKTQKEVSVKFFINQLKRIKLKKETLKAIQQVRQETAQYG